MEPQQLPEGEFHHFQLVGPEGDIPLSITVLLHVNRPAFRGAQATPTPIETEDVIALHEALGQFDGNFIKAFQRK